MRAVLISISVITLFLGVIAGFHQVIQIPPDYPVIEARREIQELSLPQSDRARLVALLDEGISRSRKERRRLESRLNVVYVLLFIVGAVGTGFGVYGFRPKNSHAELAGASDGGKASI